MVSLPAELVAAAILVDFWSSINNAVWITIFGLLLIASNSILVRIYGELEFFFASLKILLIVGVNIMALVIVCGGGPDHHTYGFQYWRRPGPLVQYLGIEGSTGRFLGEFFFARENGVGSNYVIYWLPTNCFSLSLSLSTGFWTVFNNAVYAYSGIENVSLPASETSNPRRNIPIAAKRIFWRVGIFYMLSIFMVGLVVPSTDENLLNSSGTAAASPFVIAASRAGIKIVPSIINAVVLTSAWSSGNSGLLNSSRTLYGLAQEGRAFKIFKRTNRLGIPYVAVGFMSLFICLGYMTLVRNSFIFIFILVDIYILTLSVVTKRFNSLHLAPRSRLSIHPRKLDRHLHRLSPILLRHEKTRHQPKSTSLEKSLAALSRLDYRSIFYSSPLNRRLHHFSPRTVSFLAPSPPPITQKISMCVKKEKNF